jgi:ribokinase
MTSLLSLGSVTVDLPIRITDAKLREIGVALDQISKVGEQELGELTRALSAISIPLPEAVSGGSVANTTHLLARAGQLTQFFGVGGEDTFGEKFKLDFERVGTEFLYPLQGGLVTGHNICFTSEGGKSTIVWTPGSNRFLNPDLLDHLSFKKSQTLLVDGFICANSEFGEESIDRAILLAKKAGTPYVMTLASVDVVSNFRDMFLRHAGDADLVAGNLSQAAVLVGLPANAPAFDVIPALKRIAPNVVITLGGAGAHVVHQDEEYQTGVRKVSVLDTTGAGDSFLGGFLLARQRGYSVPRALDIGTYFAGEIVQYLSPRLPPSVDAAEVFRQAEGWSAAY